MKLKNWFIRRIPREDPLRKDKQELYIAIRKAHAEWVAAVQNLDYAVQSDHIDYVIYTMEAAEKKYEMLLRRAKRLKLHALEAAAGKAFDEPWS